LTLPFAALGAIVAALIETSVLPELPVGGTTTNLVFVLAVVATVLIGVEDGLVWAFLGGLMLDLLVPARPLGATTFVFLLVVGVTFVATRIVGQGRLRAVAAAFLLTWLFIPLLLTVLAVTGGVALRTFDPGPVVVASILNAVVAVPAAVAFAAIARRFGDERTEW